METKQIPRPDQGLRPRLNGVELGAGFDPATTTWRSSGRSSRCSRYKPQEVETRFGAILDAFRFGCPPHGGFAIGVDRLLALIQGQEDIADVIAFPKNRAGEISSSARRGRSTRMC